MAGRTDKRSAFTLVEAVIVAVVIAVILAVTIPWIREREQARQRAICRSNLNQLGLVIWMYVNENQGGPYPRPDGLKILLEDIYPAHLTDPNYLMCPADFELPVARTPEADIPQWYFDNSSYWYIAHEVTNDEEGQAYIEAYRRVIGEGDGNLDADLVAPGVPEGKIKRTGELTFKTDFNIPPPPASNAAAQSPCAHRVHGQARPRRR
jgi:type II secretory pathway pseudopilin PulG